MMKKLCSITLCLALSSAVHAESHDVYGLWLTEAQDGHVSIEDCGDGTPCGKLVWVSSEAPESELDFRNKDEALRDRALIGVPIIWGFEKAKKNWKGGKIYNPEDGRTFNSTVRRLENGTLKVKGCVGPICITNIWTPVQDVKRGT
jgi:uncharacterized protein (DUF2147 family)